MFIRRRKILGSVRKVILTKKMTIMTRGVVAETEEPELLHANVLMSKYPQLFVVYRFTCMLNLFFFGSLLQPLLCFCM